MDIQFNFFKIFVVVCLFLKFFNYYRVYFVEID